jgi:hypothetical protein
MEQENLTMHSKKCLIPQTLVILSAAKNLLFLGGLHRPPPICNLKSKL